MVGHGKVSDLDSKNLPPNITYHNFGLSSQLEKLPNAFGPEVGLAQVLNDSFPNQPTVLIKYAVGGSSLLDWSPNYDSVQANVTGHPQFGALYDSLMMRVDSVSRRVPLRPVAFLWMQGERDAKIAAAGQHYYRNFTTLINRLRHDLEAEELPVLIGQINPPTEAYPARQQVRRAQDSVVATVSNTVLVRTDDLDKWDDHLHYSSVGQQELGRRFGFQVVPLLKEIYQ